MDVSRTAYNIRLAKKEHAYWLKCADALVRGRSVGKKCIPAYREQSLSSEWLYEHSDELSQLYQKIDESEVDLFHFDIVEQIGILRYEMHEIYLELFRRYFPETNTSFFANLFNLKRKISDQEESDAKELLCEMKRVAEELERMLDGLEQSLFQLCKINST